MGHVACLRNNRFDKTSSGELKTPESCAKTYLEEFVLTVDFHIDEWGGGVQVKRNIHFLVFRFHLNQYRLLTIRITCCLYSSSI